MTSKPAKPYSGILPSTRARSKALYDAYADVREALASEDYTRAVGKLSEAHDRAKSALTREYSLRRAVRIRKRESLPVKLMDKTLGIHYSRLTGQLLGGGGFTGALDSFKKEVQSHLFVAAPAHAAMKRIYAAIENASKTVLDPDETAGNLKPAEQRRIATEVKEAAAKFLWSGNAKPLEEIVESLGSKTVFTKTPQIGHLRTRLAITRFVKNLRETIQSSVNELEQIGHVNPPSKEAANLGQQLGIDVPRIHGVANENLRWKTILPARIRTLAELEKRYGPNKAAN